MSSFFKSTTMLSFAFCLTLLISLSFEQNSSCPNYSYSYPFGSGFVSNPLGGAVRVIGSNLYVAGYFSSVSGNSVSGIAQFNLTNSTWSSLDGTSDPSSYVFSLAVVGTDLYAAGYFFVAGRFLAVNYIAKFNTQTSTWSNPFGTGLNANVLALHPIGNDLYVGGYFTDANGISVGRIAKFNIQTSTWSNPFGTGLSGGNVEEINSIGNDLYVGGTFTNANGISVGGIAKFNIQTSTWSNPFGTGASGTVFAIHAIGNDLYVGGYFTMINGTSTNTGIAKFNTQTSTWSNPFGTGTGGGLVSAITSISTDLFIGGYFSMLNGTISAGGIAKFNTQTSTWSNPFGLGFNSSTLSALVADIYVNGLDLYATGSFQTAGGLSSPGIAKIGCGAPTPIPTPIPTPAPTPTPSVPTPAPGPYAIGGSTLTGVNNILTAFYSNGSYLYAGGSFSNVGDSHISATNIAKYDTVNMTWYSVGFSGTNDYVYAIQSIGSDLYVGGNQFIARYFSANSSWVRFSLGSSDFVRSMQVVGTNLYISGNLGSSLEGNGLLKYDSLASNFSRSSFGDGLSVATGIYMKAVGTDLYIVGGFVTANSRGSLRITRFDTITSTFSNLGAGLNGVARGLTLHGNILYVGGAFSGVNGTTSFFVAPFDTITLKWLDPIFTQIPNYYFEQGFQFSQLMNFNVVQSLSIFCNTLFMSASIPGFSNADILLYSINLQSKLFNLTNTNEVYAIDQVNGTLYYAGLDSGQIGTYRCFEVPTPQPTPQQPTPQQPTPTTSTSTTTPTEISTTVDSEESSDANKNVCFSVFLLIFLLFLIL